VFYALNHLPGLGGPVTGEGVIGVGGQTAGFEIWNSCYTPRESEWIVNGAAWFPQASTAGRPPPSSTRTAAHRAQALTSWVR
jgi:hypothetical protein